MCFDDHPAASADDAHDRQSIMRLSMQRAVEWHGVPFVSTVYIGDGVWDARACRGLGIPFIGIGSGIRAARLASEGAVRVFQDYSDADLFLESLDEITQAVNKSLQATREGALSSASRFTPVGPACLSSGRSATESV
jgi:hypothetical protein